MFLSNQSKTQYYLDGILFILLFYFISFYCFILFKKNTKAQPVETQVILFYINSSG